MAIGNGHLNFEMKSRDDDDTLSSSFQTLNKTKGPLSFARFKLAYERTLSFARFTRRVFIGSILGHASNECVTLTTKLSWTCTE
ncbi:hypothetical protein TNCV_2923221 [Trichonephila clavipes]|nr:hypothetical protein TNCV_2923221 [Trichonephila clavipes]